MDDDKKERLEAEAVKALASHPRLTSLARDARDAASSEPAVEDFLRAFACVVANLEPVEGLDVSGAVLKAVEESDLSDEHRRALLEGFGLARASRLALAANRAAADSSLVFLSDDESTAYVMPHGPGCKVCGHTPCPFCVRWCDVLMDDDPEQLQCCDGRCSYDEAEHAAWSAILDAVLAELGDSTGGQTGAEIDGDSFETQPFDDEPAKRWLIVERSPAGWMRAELQPMGGSK